MLGPIEIAPSILSADQMAVAADLATIESADLVHVDVMDGHFVPPITFGASMVSSCRRATTLPLDVHLMVDDPDACYADYLEAGADILTFHVEAATHSHRIVEAIHAHGSKAGVALCPATPVSALEELVGIVDQVLVMTVDPGYGGQPFIEASLAKLSKLKALCDRLHCSPVIEVDGGINARTAADVVAAGATRLVAGSAVFGSDYREQAISILREYAARGLSVEA
ncbi:MAG: ribulose-phosphate 3-epimerase [Atopobiaceae bacterium]|nr:ribulose-phosphate 3-epimerase [Atopobiaceae bacterium]MCH4180010.1 ribulose-phosphate 3-epimerase [Atopobiaceae bacterium]MCH4213938.1 ribulose-phosphate 3-epimerase [Atopobiaceae bacterium]MCH4229812.1 ribulose-phosphate 3-epimerase [Atopobiaceae bacterium]MCH4275599.1 ribulose-phosphate 3-epimerase [Atopobiaceae bacterium]